MRGRLEEAGYSASDRAVLARHLVDAESAGYRSHGLRRLPGILDNAAESANAEAHVEEIDGGLKYRADGQQGIVAVQGASEAALRVVERRNAAIVAVTGYSGTTGEVGAYTRYLSRAGVASLIVCNSEYAVAPYGGSRAILGTNPIAVGFPTSNTPFSADFATAAWSYGKIKEFERAGKELPPDVVLDEAGNPSTNPSDADNGTQLPMAGHKGYALGLAIELLAGPLIGGKAGRNAVQGSDGTLIIAFAADMFRGIEEVESDAEALFDELRAAPVRDGFDRIRIPGESHPSTLPIEIEVADDMLQLIGLA